MARLGRVVLVIHTYVHRCHEDGTCRDSSASENGRDVARRRGYRRDTRASIPLGVLDLVNKQLAVNKRGLARPSL